MAELSAPLCPSLPQAGRKVCRDCEHPDCACTYVCLRVHVCMSACMYVGAYMCVACMGMQEMWLEKSRAEFIIHPFWLSEGQLCGNWSFMASSQP